MRRWCFPLPRVSALATALNIAVLLIVVALSVAVVMLVVRSVDQGRDTRQVLHRAIQANVQARYDDCLASNRLRGALRAQVAASKRTDPVLYKLVPSLDTPQVHAIVKAERERQLRAFTDRDCGLFAMESVPAGERGRYAVPGR